jgi:hypothetical protein
MKELYAYRLQVGLRSNHNRMVSHTTQIRAGIISMACIKKCSKTTTSHKACPEKAIAWTMR